MGKHYTDKERLDSVKKLRYGNWQIGENLPFCMKKGLIQLYQTCS